jgi:Exopolysaccharide biosynthesis protein YbjH
MLAVTGFGDTAPLAESAVQNPDLYPAFSWSVVPYIEPAYFDPAQPIRADIGLDLAATYRPAPGWVIAGKLRHRLAGNVKDGRLSSSALPPVRTDQVLYAQEDTTINNLYVARYWRAGSDLYARATAGYFEYGYGGLSTELLWKPVNSLLALGVEANYAIKRDYDQRFGFRDYRIFTGHASAYMDFDNGFHAQVDAGRYLAGDIGATFGIDRVFRNGWSVGGFFTLTNVSSADFGEGSFDKGIRFQIPVNWFLGKPSRQLVGTTIRPIQRDGGARMYVPGRLYGQVRDAHQKALQDQWSRFWE